MKKAVRITSATLIATTLAILSAPAAMAHDQGRVSWSISVGSSYPAPVYGPPPVVYVQPQPVYVQPRPVYVQPQPVYVQPQPVYVQPQPVYVERAPLVEYRSYHSQPNYVREARHHRRHHGQYHYRMND
jgi:hypothetical protein